ncbi:MAG TPA: phospholipid carrier-dependent glycosyltransferase, partial [Anaerolineae bacterium]|nr:phospholipid carrier-dependent glycosyltransferase [Anaerolineae bacterium]
MTEKRWIALILALFILLGTIYAVTTPVFEASDELWHYPMVRHLADGNPLPVQVFDPALAGPWNQEASQPPLYYYLGAALTFWIDTSDMEAIRWLNPHVDNGIITADGNNNLAVHNPAWDPLQGTLLAVRIVRLFSVLLGAATVYLTYRIGREAVPDRPEIGLGAAAVNAFMPMFIFISGAVNNDNLAMPLASLALLLLIRMVGKRYSVIGNRYWVWWLLVGVVVGLALLTKEGTFALIPLVGGTAVLSQWQAYRAKTEGGDLAWRQWLGVLGRGVLIFGLTMIPALLIAGWWYARNLNLYGDLLGWSAFIAVLGQRAHPASLIQLWSERHGFMMSYWGLFGGVNVPMPAWIYAVLNGVLVLAVVGFGIFVIRILGDWILEIGRKRLPISNPSASSGQVIQSLISNIFLFVERYFALVVCFLFASAVVYGLVKWATTTWSSQGRLVFTALSALCVLLVTGLVGWLPQRPSRWIVGGLAGFMFLVAATAPFLWIQPAYATGRYAEIANPTDTAVTFGGKMRLTGYEISPRDVQPGDEVDLWLEWELLQPMARDWSVFVHLTDPVLGVPIAQRDMYPDQGLRPTSLLRPGERIVNFYRLRVPDTAVAP